MKTIFILAFAALTAAFSAAQEQQAPKGDPAEFTIAMGKYATDLNPYKAIFAHEMQIFTGIYEGLFSYDPKTLDPLPAQAESFTKSKDGKTYTFVLREGLFWSDGSRVTSEDYVESWLYLLNPLTKAEYAVFFDIVKGAKDYRNGKSRKPGSVGVKATDERTITVSLETPASYFIKLLCHSSFVPIHKSLRGKRSWEPSDIVSNGPYTLESKDDAAIVLRKNLRYWDEANVAVPSIKILFMEDDTAATEMFNSGEIQWLTDLGDTDSIASPDTIQFSPMFATSYYIWNCSRKPWNDSRVRRALALLVPWEEIRNEDNYFSPSANLILPFLGYDKVTGIEKADADEARKLLTEAGFADPSTLPPIVIQIPDYEMQKKNVEIISRAWTALGIVVDVETVPGQEFGRKSRQKPYTLSFASWIGDFADPIAFLQMWTSDSSLNETFYKSSAYDKLIDESMRQDGAARLKTLAAAERILLAEAAMMPTNFITSFNLVDTEWILGWYINPLDIHPLKTIHFGTIPQPPSFAFLFDKELYR